MGEKNDWQVSIVRNRDHEELWTATAKRGDFEFTQNVAANDGEITAFVKTARTMWKQFCKDNKRAGELAEHFDKILESEDQREADEAVAAEKAAADALAKEKADREAAEAQAVADAEAAVKAAAEPPPVPEVPAEAPPDPISDAPQVEGSNEKVS